MSKTYSVAVVGATGAVGEAMLAILAERNFPIGKLHLLASARSAGEKISFGSQKLVVEDLASFDPAGIDVALFSAGGSVSKEFAPKFAAAGAVVIDNSSAFRYDDDVPLVVAEVNPEQVENRPRGIIANPNCSTMQMLVALAPIHRAVGIERINVATYQSVSGAGRSAMEELGRQTAAMLNFQPHEPAKFPVQIAFNLIPHIDDFLDNGYTKEEMKMVWETRKILGDESIQVNPTAVRVPVFFGHSEAVHLETRRKLSADEARELLEFIGLPWEDRCLAFYEAKRPVKTASVTQVREPIYTRSVDRWKKYGDAVQPLVDRLVAAGDHRHRGQRVARRWRRRTAPAGRGGAGLPRRRRRHPDRSVDRQLCGLWHQRHFQEQFPRCRGAGRKRLRAHTTGPDCLVPAPRAAVV